MASNAEIYTMHIQGLQEAQRRNQRRIMMMQPGGKLGREIKRILAGAQRYAIGVTHVDTGALRASHRMLYKPTKGRIYISPSATNPRTGQRPFVYGPYEHDRGGDHAFYTRTKEEYALPALRRLQRTFGRRLLNGSG